MSRVVEANGDSDKRSITVSAANSVFPRGPQTICKNNLLPHEKGCDDFALEFKYYFMERYSVHV